MIYYVGCYNCEEIRHEDRLVSPAAENKMNYIISALEETGADCIEVVSPAETRKCGWVRGKKQPIRDRVMLKTFPSVSSRNKLIRIFGHLLTRLCFFLYLMTHVSAGDQVIVYHSLIYMRTISLVRKIKKCTLILEAEEIYADVQEDERLRAKELAYLQKADKYIFITDLLRQEINTEKAFVISHGTYREIPDSGNRFADNRTHVVYAGTFHPVKGGVFQAIAAAEYLDQSYVLHILGGGSATEIENVQQKICETARKTRCEIRYAGYKSGDDFNAYIQSCHIGLSTQQPDGKFNATSFPSKILMYMSNGLRVVSVRIPAIETSAVGKYIHYYDSQDPKEIAAVIKSVQLNDEYSSREILNELHQAFIKDLRKLLT